MTTILEGELRIDFAGAWKVLKWDDHVLYGHGIGKLNGQLTDSATGTLVPEGTKAIDIIALDAHALHLIEIKDFRGFAEQNERRQEHELPLEIGLKVRDTLAGLLGAYALGRQLDVVAPFVRVLLERRLPIRVIAWIAEDVSSTAHARKKRKPIASTRRNQLAQRLQWLTKQVWIDDPLRPDVVLPGVQVQHAHGSPLRAP